MRILQTTHLTKEYGQDASLVKALDDVSLSVEAGQFVAIIGTSGSGKSTLLNMLGGLNRPTGGTVKVDNFQLEERFGTRTSPSSAASGSVSSFKTTT